MTSAFAVLIAANWILIDFGVIAQTPCPVKCVCKAKESTCSNIKSIFSDPFPQDIVNVTITGSYIVQIQEHVFGTQFENIFIESTTIAEISSYAFSDFPFLKTLRFKWALIGNIRPWSFYNITSPAVIEFIQSTIERIEPEAILLMQGLERISFNNVMLGDIDTYAFSNIGVREFLVTDVVITNVNTSSFHTIFNVEKLQFFKVDITSMKAGAFTNIKNVNTVKIDDCNFSEMHCNAIMRLREATPGNHDNFIFSNSKLVCDCHISSILDYVRNNKNALSDSVVCIQNKSVFKPLTTFKIPTSCKGRDKICESFDDHDITTTFTNDVDMKTKSTKPNGNMSLGSTNAAATHVIFFAASLHLFTSLLL